MPNLSLPDCGLSVALVSPRAPFWDVVARRVVQAMADSVGADLEWRVIVPTAALIPLCRAAIDRAVLQTGGLGGNGTTAQVWCPPRITTLTEWLDKANLWHMGEPDSARILRLYGVLRETAWLKKIFSVQRNTDLLPLAQLLITLSNELSEVLGPLWASSTSDEVEERWQMALNTLPVAARSMLSDEATLVWNIWKTQVAAAARIGDADESIDLDQDEPVMKRLYAGRALARASREALIWISPVEPQPVEQDFLEHYAEAHPVMRFGLDWGVANAPVWMRHAWADIFEVSATSPAESDHDAPEVALPLLMPATGVEQEARQGARAILAWQAGGCERIAVIVQDRIVARRLTSLLYQAGMPVNDETGWKLSTTRAAAALTGWFDCVTTQGDSQAVLDFLKSPFVLPVTLGVATPDDKQRCLLALEQTLRQFNMTGGWEALQAGAQNVPLAGPIIRRMARMARQFSARALPSEWQERLDQVADVFGMRTAWQRDAAGVLLLEVLDEFGLALVDESSQLSRAECRAWLMQRMDSVDVSAPVSVEGAGRGVSLLPLNGIRLRPFDAVLVLGADAARLPSASRETLFFANAVRSELGLTTRESLQQQQLRDLAGMLFQVPKVILSWQSMRHGEENAVSPWVQRLQLACEQHAIPLPQVWQPSPVMHELAAAPPVQPRPVAPQLMPQRLSASGYNSLFACAYQFYAGRMLRLSVMDEWQDGPEKRDYGNWLHGLLHRYHEQLSAMENPPAIDDVATRQQLLEASSQTFFEQEVTTHAGALAYWIRWQKQIPAYVEWCRRHEQEGWRVAQLEQQAEKQFPISGTDRVVMLNGRIDRIDQTSSDSSLAAHQVIDYKTGSTIALRKKIKEKTDWQLPFYGLLSDLVPDNACYLPLGDSDKIAEIVSDDYVGWIGLLIRRLEQDLSAIALGAALPANGAETTCQYCDMRGLCRRGVWATS